MSKSTLQRQKLIADLIEEGKITSQNQLKGILSLIHISEPTRPSIISKALI